MRAWLGVRPSVLSASAAWLALALTLLGRGASGAVSVSVGDWLPSALEQAELAGESEVLLAAGTYSTAGARVYLSVARSLHFRAVGGVAVIDCGGQGSGVDILLSTGMNVTFSDIAFRNCTSLATAGRPARTWGPGHGPLLDWCRDWGDCGCAMEKCSKGGAVTITNALTDTSEEAEVHNASVSFFRCDFSDNKADRGGAVAFFMYTNFSDSAFHFEDCRFSRNKATLIGGAAIDVMADWAYNLQYYDDGNRHTTILRHVAFSMQGCTFEDNADALEGAVAFWSEAAIVQGLNFSARQSKFVRNRGGNGAAISLHVGRTLTDEMNTFLLEGVLFDENTAGEFASGGAVLSTFPMSETVPNPPTSQFYREYAYKVQIITRDTIFRSNHANVGGAYSTGNGLHSFRNVSFVKNSAKLIGGAICSGCIAGGDAQFESEDSVFEENSASEAASTLGMQTYGAVSLKSCSFNLTGSKKGVTDFSFNRAGVFHADGDTSWWCQPDQRMLTSDNTVSSGVEGNMNPDWNGESRDVRINRMSVTCLSCPLNQYTKSRSILQGPAYLYINSTDDPNKLVHLPGTGNFEQVCLACPRGQFVENAACQSCPAGKSLLGDGSITLTGEHCARDLPYVLFEVVMLVILTACWLLVPVLTGCPIPVKDVSFEQGQLVVATCGKHRLLPAPLCEQQVWLRGTEHPGLDGRGAPFGVRVLDSERLVLLDGEGAPVRERMDTSMGFLCFNHWRAPLSAGFGGCLPVSFAALLLVAAAAAIIASMNVGAGDLGAVATLACLLAAARILWNWRHATQTPLAKRREAFRRQLLTDKKKPEPCSRGPERAMSVGKLCDFYEYFQAYLRDHDMYYACANLIKPLTQPEKLSYVELVGPSRIQFFVSHYWGTQVRHLVESISKHAQQFSKDGDWKSCAYWICSFSNSQFKLAEELPGTCDGSSFYLALRDGGCRGTAMVLDEEAEPLKRSWCLFELLQTFLLREEREEGFDGLSLCTSSGVLNSGGTRVDIAMSIAKRLATLDLQQANASRAEDKEMIENQVRMMPGGFRAMNRLLRSCVRDSLAKVRDHFEDDFEQIVSALDGCTAGMSMSTSAYSSEEISSVQRSDQSLLAAVPSAATAEEMMDAI